MSELTLSDIWTYDSETYPNWYSVGFKNMETGVRLIFEMSPRCDHADHLWQFLFWAKQHGQIFLGFNNLHFDWPILQLFMDICSAGRRPTATDMYVKAQAIIEAPRGDWSHNLWESDHHVRQIDVFALMHFNRLGQGVSLKMLEVFMRSSHVEDLPHPPGVPVPPEMYDPMNQYMMWDIDQTEKFANMIWDRIEFRNQLDHELGGRTRLNANDVKIGADYLVDELRKAGVKTHDGKQKRQTPRHGGINFADFVIPVDFDSDELRGIHRHFMNTNILPDQTKGFFVGLSADIGGMKCDFGTGGLHGAVPSTTWHSCSQRVIQLRDAVSMYPTIAVQYGYHPEHLTTKYVDVFSRLLEERKSHPKGSLKNGAYKLALNGGGFGKLNDKFSPLYDPQAMLAITITGQLLLARLAEVLNRVPSLQLIQANTDGVAYCVDRVDLPAVDEICAWWEQWSRLELETDWISLFAQRDVNSYICVIDDV